MDEQKIANYSGHHFASYVSQHFPDLNTLRSLILCNDSEIMQHLSTYINVFIIKGLPEPSIHLQITIANHLLNRQPCFSVPYVQFLISRIQKFLFRRLFSWEWPLEAEGLSEATERWQRQGYQKGGWGNALAFAISQSLKLGLGWTLWKYLAWIHLQGEGHVSLP